MLSTSIQALLKPNPKKLPSSESFETAIAKAQAEAESLRQTVKLREGERPGFLLTASDPDVARFDEELGAARRQIERLETAIPILGANLKAARLAESNAVLDGRIREGLELQARGVELIGRYGTLSAELRDVVVELREIDGRIVAIQEEAKAAGRGDDAPLTAEQKARPRADCPLYSDKPSAAHADGHRQGGVALPSATGEGPMLFGSGPVITLSEREEGDRRAEEYQRNRMREQLNRIDPMPTRPTGVYDAQGNPDVNLRREYDAYEQNLHAWRQRRARLERGETVEFNGRQLVAPS